ncbi:12936_t:CDS:2 [Ambispora gerdemannii]|uniref:12936_t:CDS:1 n=1 Tax=Ambispora gerdemannii TaxID=144530 RepID=A0A9N9CE31_9GLOM|nr:12936_t:CDS:2 [Ambispora gerdemannii]
MDALYDSTCDFLRVALPEHITAFSVVYHAMNEEPWIAKETLRQIFHQAITAVMPSYKAGSEKYQKLQGLPLKFDDAFEGMCSLRDFEVTREEEELSTETIENNLRLVKGNLKKSKARYAKPLRKIIGRIKSSELSWRNPLASQVLSSEMMEVKQLSEEDYESFMEPAKNMEASLPHSIERACDIFLTNYDDGSTEIPPQKLSYKNWRESKEVLRDIAVRILDTLGEIWKNPAFSPKFAKTQSEGTYVADIIVPIIRATLKDLPIGKSAYVSTNINQTAVSESKIAKELADSYELLLELEELDIVGYTNQEMAEEADKNARVYLRKFEEFHDLLEDDLGVLIKKFVDIGVKKFWFTSERLPLFPNVSSQQLHEIFVKKSASNNQCSCLESKVKKGKLSQIYIRHSK